MTGTVLSLGMYIPSWSKEADLINRNTNNGSSVELNAWISIDTSGKITLTNHRAEMGQGSYQSVAQILAEELEVDMNQVTIVFASGNSAKYGSQVTGGSSTIRGSYKRLLRLGASAREMLIQAAAKKWNVDPSSCHAENAQVIHQSTGRKLNYGELVEAASKMTPPSNVKLKHPGEYKILRKPLPRQDTPMKVNGKAIFGTDFRLPGMLSWLYFFKAEGEVPGVKNLQDAYVKKYGAGNYVPPVNLTYWSFRLMVGAGTAMVGLAILGWLLPRTKKLARWLPLFLWLLVPAIFLPYLANSTGWLVTEMGRQPWIIYGVMKTESGVSPILTGEAVLISLVAFTLLYGALMIVDIYLLAKYARHAPEETKVGAY